MNRIIKIIYGRWAFRDIAITCTRLQDSEDVNSRLYQIFKAHVLEINSAEPDKRKK